eukprot:2416349-Alexandrium_andersonii.AAC.1
MCPLFLSHGASRPVARLAPCPHPDNRQMPKLRGVADHTNMPRQWEGHDLRNTGRRGHISRGAK